MDQLFVIKPSSIWYFVFSLGGSLFVRVVISYFGMREAEKRSRPLFWEIFKGNGYKEDLLKPPIAADHWLGFWLGLLELLAYPILLKSDHAAYIGAWLAFKTAHRWGYAPGYKRGTYNRYLLANALIICISYLIAYFFVDP
jgi:hypothetical protein